MSFAEVLGHEARVAELRRALAEDRLPHALLFSGKAGVGKRRTAEALAAARLCDTASDDACGTCPSCRAHSTHNHPDVEVILREEGKRDLSIEQVRELSERLHRKGHRGRGRFAIVDDADRLTVQAQNAFLKTLEEPPPGTTVVLVTSNAERLLPTVRSRCSIHRFAALREEDLRTFARRAGLEPLPVPLSLAHGAPGKLLLLSRPDVVQARELAVRFALRPAGTSPFEVAAEFLELAEAGAREDGEAPQEELRERMRDRLRVSLRLLAAAFRDLRILALGVPEPPLLHEDRAAELSAAAARAPADAAERYEAAADVCDAAVLDLRGNVDRALLLEDAARRIRLELAG